MKNIVSNVNVMTFVNKLKNFNIEIDNKNAFISFYKNIILCFDVMSEQPLKITEHSKKKVIEFLDCYDKIKYPDINKIIAFFNKMSVGECCYIYPYELNLEFINLFTETLQYFNENYDHEFVAKMIAPYVEKQLLLEKLTDEIQQDYEIFYHSNYNKKEYFGEMDKEKRVCIYCNRGKENGAKFIEIAHAIPEALGNKKIIQCEECDECNDYFSNNMEEDLANFLSLNRVIYGTRGKNGYPTMSFGCKLGKYFDFSKIDADKDLEKFNVIKDLINTEEFENFKGAIIVENQNSINNSVLKLTNSKTIVPVNIYKSLCKIAIGTLEKYYLKDFEETIKWLRYGKETKEETMVLPKVGILTSNQFIAEEPEVVIFIRKDENNMDFPYCFAEFRVVNLCFVYIIPFSNQDTKKFVNEEEFMKFWNYQKRDGNYKFEFLDFSSNSPLQLNFKINICDEEN